MPEPLQVPLERAKRRWPKVNRRGWWVVCNNHAKGPFKFDSQAERTKTDIERIGACPEQHEVVQCV